MATDLQWNIARSNRRIEHCRRLVFDRVALLLVLILLTGLLGCGTKERSKEEWSSHLVAASFIGGLYESRNGGDAWYELTRDSRSLRALSKVCCLSQAYPHLIYIGTYGSGLWEYDRDTGRLTSFGSNLAEKHIRCLAVAPGLGTSETLLLGTKHAGVFLSTDRGASWEAASRGLTEMNINCLWVEKREDPVFYCCTPGGAFQTNDPAQGWDRISTPASGNDYRVVCTLREGGSCRLLLGCGRSSRSPVFFSDDQGATWEEATGLPASNVLALVPGDPGSKTLYAGTTKGVFVSRNGGTSWRTLGANGASVGETCSLVITEEGLFAGCTRGLFRWRKSSDRWEQADVGMPESSVTYVVAPAT